MQESEGRGWWRLAARKEDFSANGCLSRTEAHSRPARAAPHRECASAGHPAANSPMSSGGATTPEWIHGLCFR
jgi:hypothetical protein